MGLEKLKHCRWLLLPFVLFRRFWIFLPKHQTWRNQNSPQNTEWVASIIRKTLQIRIRMCSKKRKKHVHRVISSKFEAVKNFNSLFMWPCPLLCHIQYSGFQVLMCYDPKFDYLRCLSASLCLKFFPRRTALLVVGVDKYPLNRAIKLATLAERPLRALCWTWSLLHLLWSLLVGYSPHSCQPLRENISSVIPDKNGKNYQKALRWTQFGQRCRNKFLLFKLSH